MYKLPLSVELLVGSYDHSDLPAKSEAASNLTELRNILRHFPPHMVDNNNLFFV